VLGGTDAAYGGAGFAEPVPLGTAGDPAPAASLRFGRPVVSPGSRDGADGPDETAARPANAGAPLPFGHPVVTSGAGEADAEPDQPGQPGAPLPFGRPAVTPDAPGGEGVVLIGTAGLDDHEDSAAGLPARRPGASATGRAGAGRSGTRSGRPQQPPFGDPATAGPGRAGAETGGRGPAQDGDELPRRVRQASLAVQLRETPPPERARGSRAEADAAERTPEQARATMAALRDGWNRGRDSGGMRHLRLQQDPHDAQPPYGDFEDFERSAADGRDDESHR
jgi:hypothetical protein